MGRCHPAPPSAQGHVAPPDRGATGQGCRPRRLRPTQERQTGHKAEDHTLWIFWGDSTNPEILFLGAGSGTFTFSATHRYNQKSFLQHHHKPYTIVAFVLSGDGGEQTLLGGDVLRFQYFPR